MDTFDLRGTIIPFSLLQISNHFNRMQPGEIFEVVGVDAAIENELRCILPARAYEILPCDPHPASGIGFIRVRKRMVVG